MNVGWAGEGVYQIVLGLGSLFTGRIQYVNSKDLNFGPVIFGNGTEVYYRRHHKLKAAEIRVTNC